MNDSSNRPSNSNSDEATPAGQRRVYPVILSGGSGTRLWPLSRELYPKQLLPLVGEDSLLQRTARRVADPGRFAAPLIVCNDDHRFIIAEQLRRSDVTPLAILLEPVGRNTAPAAAAAALTIMADDPAAVMLVLPSDHVIPDEAAFLSCVDAAVAAAADGSLVTFGVAPSGPETGYGYIRAGASLADGPCRRVDAFVEKPDLATAEKYVADGEYFWNSGMFVFAAAQYLAELERRHPAMVAGCRAAVDAGVVDLEFRRLDVESFSAIPADSIDYAVMEKTQAAAMVPADFRWSDLGSWSAMWEVEEKDTAGNVLIGDVATEDVRNSYIRAGDKLVTALGVDNMVIVATDDVVFVADRDRSQDVKALVQKLKAADRVETVSHTTVYRPWGSYQTIDAGDRFQVKRIVVNPGAKLSLQKHFHRAEHWVVVNGTAKVTRGDDTLLLHENESTYIPLGTFHRLENPGKVPLNLIEVQSGAYLGEDDIERIDDAYGRT